MFHRRDDYMVPWRTLDHQDCEEEDMKDTAEV